MNVLRQLQVTRLSLHRTEGDSDREVAQSAQNLEIFRWKLALLAKGRSSMMVVGKGSFRKRRGRSLEKQDESIFPFAAPSPRNDRRICVSWKQGFTRMLQLHPRRDENRRRCPRFLRSRPIGAEDISHYPAGFVA